MEKKMEAELKGSIVLVIFLLLISSVSACTNATESSATNPSDHLNQSGWELVWKDDFTGKELDDSKWTLCTRGTPNWKDTMSDDPRLLKIESGVLHLRGIVNDKQDEDPAPYLTAGVTSRGKYSFKHGKVQIRARFKSA